MRKPYLREISPTWYLKSAPYRWFMVREMTSVFIAAYLVFLVVLLFRLAAGAQSFERMLVMMQSPVSIVFHAVVLAAALYHSITWFNLTPKVMPVRIGEEKLPDSMVAIGMGYLPWVVLSALLVWGVLR
jgi:fumarate reductase subunit C